ncbi:MAG: HD-GYP domain-containing protein [Candidatus Geothermincolia bacterium]
MDSKLKAMIGAQALVVAGTVAYRAIVVDQPFLWFPLALFGLAVVLAESLSERAGTGVHTTYGIIPLMGAMVALGGLSATLAALFGAVSLRGHNRGDPWRAAFNGLQYAVSIAAASFVYAGVGGHVQSLTVGEAGRSLPALLLAAIVFYAVNSAQVALAVTIEKGRRLVSFYTPANLSLLINHVVYALAGFAAGIIYAQNAFHKELLVSGVDISVRITGGTGEAIRGFFALVAFFTLLAVAWYFSGKDIAMRRGYDQTLVALTGYIERREPYLEGHSERVASLTALTAKRLKMGTYDITRLYHATLLHDVGKTVVPREILLKPGVLTEEEFERVQRHPLESGMRLEGIDYLVDEAQAVYHHHEEYDGGGYIDGLGGETIPLGARILAVADAYDAMVNDRPWRPAKPVEEAKAELRQNEGVKFDPRVVAAFLASLEELEAADAASAQEEQPEPEALPHLSRLVKQAQAEGRSRRESKTERRRRELQERRRLRDTREHAAELEAPSPEEETNVAAEPEGPPAVWHSEQNRVEPEEGGEDDR